MYNRGHLPSRDRPGLVTGRIRTTTKASAKVDTGCCESEAVDAVGACSHQRFTSLTVAVAA